MLKLLKYKRVSVKKETGFTLIEVVITAVIIGILAGAVLTNYARVVEKEAKSVEAREVLNKAYAGYQRLLMDDEPIGGGNPVSWGRFGMSDPNGNAGRFFNYDILPNLNNPTRVRAERIGDTSKWLEIDISSGALTTASFYQ